MNYKPALEYAGFIALSDLVTRLQEHAKITSNLNLACDIAMAASLIENLLRNSDDFK
jgi:hypothetical protein